jgi:hypothetical protein
MRVLLAALAILLALAQWLIPPGPARQPVAFLQLWIVPALAWHVYFYGNRWGHLPGVSRSQNLAEGISRTAGMALLSGAILALILHLIPGPISRLALVALALASAFLPLILPQSATELEAEEAARGGKRAVRRRNLWTSRYGILLLAVLLLATILRTANLGYKEFQGDEGLIMTRAAAALQGDDDQLFLHQKGPGEILLPLATWGLTGSINESWSRAVFTWAGVLTVLAIVALGRRWFDSWTGLLAGLLYALGGFGVAFSRIVQYQNLVTLWTILALLHAARYRARGRRLDLLLAATFLAGGGLAHYDAILAAPAIGWLLLARVRTSRKLSWRPWALAFVAGAAILGIFYVPYALSPTFGSTGRYLLNDRLGGSILNWSGSEAWRMSTFYNSTYYVVGLLGMLAAGFWLCWRQGKHFAAVLYVAVPLLFYTGIVADPRTHVYTIFPGAAILGAAGAASLWRRLTQPAMQRTAVAVFALFCLVSTVYVILLFVDVNPERQRTWSANRPRFYPTTWQEPPQYGLFGFPHQAGWRVASSLVDELPYASNEEQEITNWYMAQAPRTHCEDYGTFLVAANAQDEVPYDAHDLQEELHLQHVVHVNARPSLHIYGRKVTPNVTQHEAGHKTLWRRPGEVAPPHPTTDLEAGRPVQDISRVGVTLADKVRLLGYELDAAQARPGGRLTVTLYWQALDVFDSNYQVFVHLYDGTLWAQHDGAPECAKVPTTMWEPGEIVRDPHVVELPTDLPTDGEIPILVGMYDLITGRRLARAGSETDTITLTNFRPGDAAP